MLSKRLLIATLAVSQLGAASAQLAPPEAVETAPLARDAFSTGTLTPATGALPSDLWRNAQPSTLEFLLENAPSRPATPAIGEAMDVFSKFKGKLLAADFGAKAVMGEWNGDRLVIVEFPNASDFKDWATSPEYLEIAKHRIAGADVSTVLAEALPAGAL